MKNFQLISYKDRFYWYAVAGVISALYLLGFFAIRSIQSNALSASLQAQIPFSIVLKDDAKEADVFAFQKELRANKAIQRESVLFISKEQAWRELHQNNLAKGDTLAVAAEKALTNIRNPLPDIIEIRLIPRSSEQLQPLLDELRQRPYVSDIWYAPNFLPSADNPSGFRAVLSLIEQNNIWLFLLGILVCFVAAALLRNTLRWHILAHNQLISNLYLFGASPQFVRSLYLSVAWRSAIGATFLVWFLLAMTQMSLSSSQFAMDWVDASASYIFLYILLAVAAFAIFIGGTYRSLQALD
jgi:cell division transport system permease protein